MKILKHGAMSDGKRVDLIGECEQCGCKFKTFVDIFRDYPNEGDIAFRTDDDCTNIDIKPEWVYGDANEWDWNSHRYLSFRPRVMANVDYHVPCPECRAKTELKVVVSK